MTGKSSLDGGRLTADGDRSDRPGSDGEHELQERFGTVDRADPFYAEAMRSSLTDRMRSFLEARRLGFVGWLSEVGPWVTPVLGDQGIVRILDDETIAWPADRLVRGQPSFDGPKTERYASLVAVDWWDSTVGLHVNGVADCRSTLPDGTAGDWIVLDVDEAYIHCAKHIPRLSVDQPQPTDRSTTTSGPTAAGQPPWPRRVVAHCAKYVPWASVDEPVDRSSVGSRRVMDRLSSETREFVDSRILGFLATADRNGETDVSPRLGPGGFVQVLDDATIAWPEYRGNGIHASLGNVYERSAASMTFVDWWNAEAIVTVSGDAAIRDEVDSAVDLTDADRTKSWVVLGVDSVTVDLDPSLPTLSIEQFDPPWGTDDRGVKKEGFFRE